MGVQPPLSPWMNEVYNESFRYSKVPVLKSTGKRDVCWLDGNLNDIEWKETPDQSIRMLDHWDNFNGTVERGYSGRSIFFENDSEGNGGFREDYELVEEYAKLLSSVRINAVCINNVNVREGSRWLITNSPSPKKYNQNGIQNKGGSLDKLKIINDIFVKYQIKTFIAINFAAPKIVGTLETSDPLNKNVVEFWEETAKEIYNVIPNFGGFVVKADSEGEPGPYAYNRNHADGANMLANALKQYNGLVIWRCFVYNHHEDWRVAGEYKVDRTKAAFDNFFPLDGKFADNVILQIKYGPTDFQIKEPITPLFGRLESTNQILEFQITQEYTGQQQHICFLPSIWNEVYKEQVDLKNSSLSKAIPNNSLIPNNSGVAAVSNVGTDANWTGNKFAQANLYGFARMAWDNSLTPEQIAKEWVELTFLEFSKTEREVIENILLTSRDTYRNYTAPLGSPSAMCRPGFHYGPYPEGYEFDRWGIYQFPNRDGFGLDRTESGTGFTKQYLPEIAKKFENLETCPDDVVSFFHFIRYDYVLHSGKTVIQHIYDSHFEGVESVEEYIKKWETFKPKANGEFEEHYENVRTRLDEQLKVAIDWRDFLNSYYHRFSGVPDSKGRKIYR